ncbi:MnmC family methyltransferase [Helicobacter sp. MIT 05-5294]|uniref:MnmC family methyltransferase n=1 Tax=Helicobacter sp. MIT 05-5294 TaxID=1548150 RepID=UPI0010FDD902|nr:MnmC family methyltransferase [Helicobacter sp. MIT 05-5294]TLD88703.1 hypothetical protein LS69_002120 [Helicobacter sp. MIT 05-5294]
MQILTQDSSITLYNEHFREAYHNANDGALQETLHKHILPALSLQTNMPYLSVLDICFGLGFNTLCLLFAARLQNFSGKIAIHSPEIDERLLPRLLSFPYPKELKSQRVALESLVKTHYFKEANFEVVLHLGDAREILAGFVENWNPKRDFQKDSNLQTQREQRIPKMPFNVIFQDPFSPAKNRSLWTYEYFKNLYVLSAQNVVITTYSLHSGMLYSAYLAGFYAYRVKQKRVRDSVILTKTSEIPRLRLENVLEITPINLAHKIKANPNLWGLYDENKGV